MIRLPNPLHLTPDEADSAILGLVLCGVACAWLLRAGGVW